MEQREHLRGIAEPSVLAADGHREDFEALFRAVYPRLVQALSVAADPETAADAVQEAFVQASRHWARVATLDNPGAWVRRTAINRLANQHRGGRRRAAVLTRLAVPVPPTDVTESDLDLRVAVAALPERQRLAVCLHYLADLSVAQVADALDVREGTVKSNLHDARRSLKVLLEGGDHA